MIPTTRQGLQRATCQNLPPIFLASSDAVPPWT